MSALIFSTALLGFVSQAAAQCTTKDNVNCVTWVKAGFCGNMGYTLAQRQASCGISCGLCTSAGVAITSGVCSGDANANCATWAANGFCNNGAYSAATKQAILSISLTINIPQAYCCTTCATPTTTTASSTTAENANCKKWFEDATNAFCASTTVTLAQKTLFCPTTCAFEVKPNADCALYTLTGTTLARETPSNRTATPGTPVASGAVAGTTTLSRAFAASGCTVSLFADAAPAAGAVATETFVGTAAASFFSVTAANNAGLSYTCVCTILAESQCETGYFQFRSGKGSGAHQRGDASSWEGKQKCPNGCQMKISETSKNEMDTVFTFEYQCSAAKLESGECRKNKSTRSLNCAISEELAKLFNMRVNHIMNDHARSWISNFNKWKCKPGYFQYKLVKIMESETLERGRFASWEREQKFQNGCQMTVSEDPNGIRTYTFNTTCGDQSISHLHNGEFIVVPSSRLLKYAISEQLTRDLGTYNNELMKPHAAKWIADFKNNMG
ncbi:hypothetical protein PRIPAC_81652 [Pristionchus pacificus]|uniref:ShK domain-containing protein n=1 Tax=Pristionchus pacificus TaxID=54126 RepID=A0A2A6CKX1_PRIPA|nr:hypothetical protein PRIPAC_81652 [Pristionchus pacificus]|eukprot:PDM78864.1 ShK domain-containing protein [Pristionchus pacificus]